MSLNIVSLSLSIVALHGHKQACFAISIVQQIQIVNPEQGCSKTSFLNRSFMLYSLAIDKPCDESHDNCFLMSWSQLYENLIDLSHHHSLFSLSFSSGSENFTWLNYSSWFKSHVRIKFGCLLKSIVVIKRWWTRDYLIRQDDQATYAIAVGTRGHTTLEVGQVTNRIKSWEISCFLYLTS